MPRFVVETTEPFDDDLRAAASWRLTNVGLSSAARFLDAYDALVAAIGEFPLMAGSVEGTLYRWRALERYVAVYVVDEDARMVTLMRLFYISADWRAHLLASDAEGRPQP